LFTNNNVNRWIAILAFTIPLVLSGCATQPVYVLPESAQKAFLKFDFVLHPMAISVAKVSTMGSDWDCNPSIPNAQTLVIISRGNPLVSDVNVAGLNIEAGKKLRVFADLIMVCSRYGSFTPKPGSTYDLKLIHTPETKCSLELTEVGKGPVKDFKYDQCISK
jgi:hypothetical protein